ncbi:MAG TPA: secondary thiamine-phosphate synthase enzyme YjbQ [Candidatus Omnitrophota bacterium]|nr:secondary thiamine-phosphate synthase enzyme YjbQ [Candidatus Omnitrophota bacterium]
MERISITSTRRVDLIDITDQIQDALSRQKTQDGICCLFCPHTTAGLTINENADPAVRKDITTSLSKLIPPDAGYTHSEGNSDSHIKASLFGPSLSVILEGGKLMLGTWQGIYFCENDGPRSRQVWITIIGK